MLCYYYMTAAGGRLGRITGLDPSGPLFYSVGDRDRLDSTDAQFVDIIHTAGYWVGFTRPTGHVDFFPNQGRAPQPGCEGSESLDLSCSHFKGELGLESYIPNTTNLRCTRTILITILKTK